VLISFVFEMAEVAAGGGDIRPLLLGSEQAP
jgi:hypothetical protein